MNEEITKQVPSEASLNVNEFMHGIIDGFLGVPRVIGTKHHMLGFNIATQFRGDDEVWPEVLKIVKRYCDQMCYESFLERLDASRNTATPQEKAPKKEKAEPNEANHDAKPSETAFYDLQFIRDGEVFSSKHTFDTEAAARAAIEAERESIGRDAEYIGVFRYTRDGKRTLCAG